MFGDTAGDIITFVVLLVEGPCAVCVAFEPNGVDLGLAFFYCAKDEVLCGAIVSAEAVPCKGGASAVKGGDYSQVVEDVGDGAIMGGVADCSIAGGGSARLGIV